MVSRGARDGSDKQDGVLEGDQEAHLMTPLIFYTRFLKILWLILRCPTSTLLHYHVEGDQISDEFELKGFMLELLTLWFYPLEILGCNLKQEYGYADESP